MLPTWSAVFVEPDHDYDGAPLMRGQFDLDAGHGEVVQATLHLSAHGVFEAFLNGQPISDEVLAPGWSSFEWRVRYRTVDVTARLRTSNMEPGCVNASNVLGMALGNGWYRGRLGWFGGGAFYGSQLAAFAQLDIEFADGHTQIWGSDTSWTAGPSAVLENDLYDGQTVDARRVSSQWLAPDFTSSDWGGVHTAENDERDRLTPYLAPPVRRQQQLAPVDIWRSPTGKTLVDFGQNIVGWVRVEVQGKAGSEVILRHAEVLEDNELGVRPLRTAMATDRYILSGELDVFEPTFTFHGFRYVEVEGWPQDLTDRRLWESGQLGLTAVVVSSDLVSIGTFECSDELLNQLHRNAVWGTRGNFLDVPTDCPQRDERLGWTGDIAAFAPSAAYLFDVEAFLGEWLTNLAVEQQAAGGRVPAVIPDVLKYVPARYLLPAESAAFWSDAAVWVPWALWQAYGHREVLEAQFDSMAAHLDHVETLLSPNGCWDRGFQFGDWLDPAAPLDRPGDARADQGVVATACFHRSAQIVTEAAQILGRECDRQRYAELAERTRKAFAETYLDADGRIFSDAPTVYALAIVFDLLDPPAQQKAGQRLAELIADGGHHIQTGFAGTPFVMDALTQTGHLDDAYQLLMQRSCPSWLYPVTMGATTVWERWDSMLPDGSVNSGEMTSFNHYALGAVVDWMHRSIGGISPLEPGYRQVEVAPQPGGGISWARSSLKSPHGLISVEWAVSETGQSVTVTPGGTFPPGGASSCDGTVSSDGSGATMTLSVRIPDGTTAVVRRPGAAPITVGAGEHRWHG